MKALEIQPPNKVPEKNKPYPKTYPEQYHGMSGIWHSYDGKDIVKAFKESGWKSVNFVMFLKDLSSQKSRDFDYNDMPTAWLDLEKAKSVDSMINAIDHIYDLEHDGGFMLDRVKEFRTEERMQWLVLALDIKYSADIRHIASLSSIPPRIIGLYNRLSGMSIFSSESHFRSAEIVTKDVVSTRLRDAGRIMKLYGYETKDPYDGLPGATPTGYKPFFSGPKMVDDESFVSSNAQNVDTKITNSFVENSDLLKSTILNSVLQDPRVKNSKITGAFISQSSNIYDSIIKNFNKVELKNQPNNKKYPDSDKCHLRILTTQVHNSNINIDSNINGVFKYCHINDSNITNTSLEDVTVQKSQIKSSKITGKAGHTFNIANCKISNVQYIPIYNGYIILKNLTIMNSQEFDEAVRNYLKTKSR